MEQCDCNICGASFENVQQLKNHFSIHQDENKEEEYGPSNEAEDDPLMQKALGNALKVITFHPEGQEKVDPLQLFSNRKEDIAKYLEDATQGKNGIKWHMSCAIKFLKYDKEGNEIQLHISPADVLLNFPKKMKRHSIYQLIKHTTKCLLTV